MQVQPAVALGQGAQVGGASESSSRGTGIGSSSSVISGRCPGGGIAGPDRTMCMESSTLTAQMAWHGMACQGFLQQGWHGKACTRACTRVCPPAPHLARAQDSLMGAQSRHGAGAPARGQQGTKGVQRAVWLGTCAVCAGCMSLLHCLMVKGGTWSRMPA